MKKILFALLMLATGTGAFAQPGPGAPPPPPPKKTPEQRADAMTRRMDRELKLEPWQHARVHDLVLNHERRMMQLRDQAGDAGKKSLKKEREDANRDFQEGLHKTLSPEQMTRWEEIRKQHRKQHFKNDKGHKQGKQAACDHPPGE